MWRDAAYHAARPPRAPRAFCRPRQPSPEGGGGFSSPTRAVSAVSRVLKPILLKPHAIMLVQSCPRSSVVATLAQCPQRPAFESHFGHSAPIGTLLKTSPSLSEVQKRVRPSAGKFFLFFFASWICWRYPAPAVSLSRTSVRLPAVAVPAPRFRTSVPHLFLRTSVPHLGSAPRFRTSVPHLESAPRFRTSVPHLGSGAPRFHTSVPHLGPAPRFPHSGLPSSFPSGISCVILRFYLCAPSCAY